MSTGESDRRREDIDRFLNANIGSRGKIMENNKSPKNNIFKNIEKVLRFMLSVFMVVLVLVVFSNVMSRYFLESAIAWSEELARFLLIWVVFIGAILAYIKDEHLGLDILVTSLPYKAGRVVLIIANLLVIFALSLVTKGGYSIAMSYMDWLSPALEVPYGYIFIIVPVCGVVMIIQTIYKMIVNIKSLTQVKQEEGLKC